MAVAINGQGLAGCCLAWELEWAGVTDFTVYDEPHPLAASRVAAGMINPLSGRNFTFPWRFAESFGRAIAFYQRVEQTLEATFWHPLPILRFVSQEEWPKLCARLNDPEVASWVENVEDYGLTGSPWRGVVSLRGGGRLAVREFCEATIAYFRSAGPFTPPSEGDRVVHCEGTAALVAGMFPGGHRSAKGEILTLFAPHWPQKEIVMGAGGWIVPIGKGFFKAGATYVWDTHDVERTAAGLEAMKAMVERLAANDEFDVVDHQAGVRPILRVSQPVVGALPDGKIVFNGLGSKGSLYAPSAAATLAAWLVDGTPIDPGFDVALLPAQPGPAPAPPAAMRPTARAHQELAAVLRAGDLAIDATAGNGHDTLFLARSVAPGGSVVSFDVQEAALAATRRKLEANQLTGGSTLVFKSHDRMADYAGPGTAAAIAFNLGYLPGGDHSLTTSPESTLAALEASARILRPGGLLSIVCYTGHPGGEAESEAVLAWADTLDPEEFSVEVDRSKRPAAPFLVLVRRLGES